MSVDRDTTTRLIESPARRAENRRHISEGIMNYRFWNVSFLGEEEVAADAVWLVYCG